MVPRGSRPVVSRANLRPTIAIDTFTALGVASERILWEDLSRSAVAVLGGAPQSDWLQVTSASHVGRSTRSFATAGWPRIMAFPVDHRSSDLAGSVGWPLTGRIEPLNITLKERGRAVGISAYRMITRGDRWGENYLGLCFSVTPPRIRATGDGCCKSLMRRGLAPCGVSATGLTKPI